MTLEESRLAKLHTKRKGTGERKARFASSMFRLRWDGNGMDAAVAGGLLPCASSSGILLARGQR
jgi:hypothetical protein